MRYDHNISELAAQMILA